jgi:2-polyprenyl-6-methoxyphenol hydroxylase-like FAD-dependent oxidoreductase
MQGYPEDVLDVVRNCEIESVSLAHICYRAPWDMVLHPFREGTVTVAGDAMHTMGPFIGAGGSASLEDALVLARCLADTAMGDDSKPARSVEEVLRSYVNQRRWRILRLTVQSYLNGQLMIESSNLKKMVLRAVLKVFFKGNSNRHDEYDCGSL